VLYNRASADPDGRPWSQRKALIWWDEEHRRWAGDDVPDFVADRPPSYRPPAGATGVDAISGTDALIMQADGKAWLFAPAGLVDGPLPAHYEPQESPFRNLLYGQQHNPVRQIIRHPENRYQPSVKLTRASVGDGLGQVSGGSDAGWSRSASASSRRLEIPSFS
jgi:formate dehydrogenase major subunit